MTNVYDFRTGKPIYQGERITASPENVNFNQIMHLRAHGWQEWRHEGIKYWYHQNALRGELMSQADAWTANRAMELARHYWGDAS